MIESDFPELVLRRRVPSLPALDHINLCIAEADTEFLCLFHDDDVMESTYVGSMLRTIERYPHAVAYGCNAAVVNTLGDYKHCSFESNLEYVVLNSPRELARRYFSRFPNGFAPFPSYIYRSVIAKQHNLDARNAGKYSDVAWLLEIAMHGEIVWNSGNLIRYRIHPFNDGGFESATGRLRMLGFLKCKATVLGKSIVDDYRFFLYKKLISGQIQPRYRSERTTQLLKQYLGKYRLMRFFRAETYSYFIYKLVNRRK
jgi:hypothetical protein